MQRLSRNLLSQKKFGGSETARKRMSQSLEVLKEQFEKNEYALGYYMRNMKTSETEIGAEKMRLSQENNSPRKPKTA